MSEARQAYPFRAQTAYATAKGGYRYALIDTLPGDAGKIYVCWSGAPLQSNFDRSNTSLFDAVISAGSRAEFDTGTDVDKYLSFVSDNGKACSGWLVTDLEKIDTSAHQPPNPSYIQTGSTSVQLANNGTSLLLAAPAAGQNLIIKALVFTFRAAAANLFTVIDTTNTVIVCEAWAQVVGPWVVPTYDVALPPGAGLNVVNGTGGVAVYVDIVVYYTIGSGGS